MRHHKIPLEHLEALKLYANGYVLEALWIKIIDPKMHSNLFTAGEVVRADIVTNSIFMRRYIPIGRGNALWETRRLHGVVSKTWRELHPLELLALQA